ncbi:MAG: hypothetical protein KDD92_15750 [Caldilineaceae bacterium]|nr:hypothetical protein [Caldilineaceae bacterium]
MISRKSLLVTVVLVFVLAVLAGCTAGTVEVPDREIDINMDDAMAGQAKGMQALSTGEVTWTEAEFSSFITELLQQNLGSSSPITSVKAWFEDDNGVVFQVGLPGGMTADLSGKIMVEDHIIQVELDSASAMGMSAAGSILNVIQGAINRALNDPSMGVLVNVETAPGEITLSYGM